MRLFFDENRASHQFDPRPVVRPADGLERPRQTAARSSFPAYVKRSSDFARKARGQPDVSGRRHRLQAQLFSRRDAAGRPRKRRSTWRRCDARASAPSVARRRPARHSGASPSGSAPPAVPSSPRDRRRGASRSTSTRARPRETDWIATSECASATPRLRWTVESVRSRCQREIGSFSRHEPQQRVGDAEIAFGILEVDRVHLVRHRRRADFAGDHLLPEVAERHVAPEVAAQVGEDRVAPREGVAVLRRSSRAARSAWCTRSSSMPSDSTSCRPICAQSTSGYAATCALKLPTAPFTLPRIATLANCSSAPRSRCTNTATSLPSVVGVAAWPCVRAIIASSACACAIARRRRHQGVEMRQQHLGARVAAHDARTRGC